MQIERPRYRITEITQYIRKQILYLFAKTQFQLLPEIWTVYPEGAFDLTVVKATL